MARTPDDRLAPTGPQQQQAARLDSWARLLLIGSLVVMFALVGRVVQLKVDPDPRLEPAAGGSTSARSELAPRGDVLDRRGRVMATSSVGYRLFVDPQEVDDLMTIALDLAELINGDEIEIDMKIAERIDSRYVVIEHLLHDWQVAAVRDAGLRGVGLEPRLVRHYPNGELAAALVGKVGFEHTGLSGAEHLYQGVLDPERGRLEYLRDARRRTLWIEPEGYSPGRPGESVRLSIDLVIQEIVERELQEVVEERNAGGGRMVVMDVRTGEILAMHDIINHREGWSDPIEDPGREIDPGLARNRCIADPYEPGSTFKPFIWAVATELGKAEPDEAIDTPDGMSGPHRTSRGRRIRDVRYWGPVSWKTVLVRSLNSGMAIVAERMSHEQMQQAIDAFGFGSPTGVGLPGETSGLITAPDNWSHYTQTSVCMGHEIGVTPLQMVRAFSAFARDGTMPPLRMTAWNEHDVPFRFKNRVIGEDIAMIAREAMAAVINEGTGQRAQSDRYQLFGKSGTAQLPRREGGGYHDGRYISSFIAGAPFDEPRIVAICVVDDPDRERGYYGGTIAGPVVRNVIDQALNYLGVPPELESEDDDSPTLVHSP